MAATEQTKNLKPLFEPALKSRLRTEAFKQVSELDLRKGG